MAATLGQTASVPGQKRPGANSAREIGRLDCRGRRRGGWGRRSRSGTVATGCGNSNAGNGGRAQRNIENGVAAPLRAFHASGGAR